VWFLRGWEWSGWSGWVVQWVDLTCLFWWCDVEVKRNVDTMLLLIFRPECGAEIWVEILQIYLSVGWRSTETRSEKII
jgi:hypothetical protein